jgi:hypothetical protein
MYIYSFLVLLHLVLSLSLVVVAFAFPYLMRMNNGETVGRCHLSHRLIVDYREGEGM